MQNRNTLTISYLIIIIILVISAGILQEVFPTILLLEGGVMLGVGVASFFFALAYNLRRLFGAMPAGSSPLEPAGRAETWAYLVAEVLVPVGGISLLIGIILAFF